MENEILKKKLAYYKKAFWFCSAAWVLFLVLSYFIFAIISPFHMPMFLTLIWAILNFLIIYFFIMWIITNNKIRKSEKK